MMDLTTLDLSCWSDLAQARVINNANCNNATLANNIVFGNVEEEELLDPSFFDAILSENDVAEHPSVATVAVESSSADGQWMDLNNTHMMMNSLLEMTGMPLMDDDDEEEKQATMMTFLDEDDSCSSSSCVVPAGSPSPTSTNDEYKMESTQDLIDDVETFLLSVSGQPTTVSCDSETKPVLPQQQQQQQLSVETKIKPTAPNSNNTASSSSDMLRALVTGSVVQDCGLSLSEEDLKNAYTTTTVGADGQSVIIIIAPSSPSSIDSSSVRETIPARAGFLSAAASPSPLSPLYESSSSSSDASSDWCPSPAPVGSQEAAAVATAGPVRKKYQRKNPKAGPPAGPYPRDKTERKKAQNRTAAYRYREKKKAEQDAVDTELEGLSQKNRVLRAKLTDIENEMRCLKKLMIETGLHSMAEAIEI